MGSNQLAAQRTSRNLKLIEHKIDELYESTSCRFATIHQATTAASFVHETPISNMNAAYDTEKAGKRSDLFFQKMYLTRRCSFCAFSHLQGTRRERTQQPSAQQDVRSKYSR